MTRTSRSILALIAAFLLAAAAFSQAPATKPTNSVSPNLYSGLVAPIAPGAKQPILILLYSRFYDHTGPQYTFQRINSLLRIARSLHQRPSAPGASILVQFSGTVSEVMQEMSDRQSELSEVKKAAADGLVEIGYTGEDEPTYGNRPRADFMYADNGDKRWLARVDAAQHFLTDYKDPVTGDPVPGLVGGIQRTQEVFGKLAYASGLTDTMGDSSPYVHELRKLGLSPMLAGFPENDPVRGVIEYRFGVSAFTKLIAPVPETAPEIFWEDGLLRSSEIAGMDSRAFSTDDGPEALKAAFAKMDRSKIRVVHMEIGSYLQFLKKGADGKPMYPPLEWTYGHPNTPQMPSTLKSVLEMSLIEDARKKEQATIDWLCNEFLPDNPGSRFVSIAAIQKYAPSSLGGEVSAQRLRLAAEDYVNRAAKAGTEPPSYAVGEGEYFSLADLFGMLSGALSQFNKTGSVPPSVTLTNVYGPTDLRAGNGAVGKEFSVAEISRVAAGLAGPIHDQTWRPMPLNTIPSLVTVNGVELNPTQFLLLMANAYTNPVADRKIAASPQSMYTTATGIYPKRISLRDVGMGWTLKPAVLHLPALPPRPPAPRPMPRGASGAMVPPPPPPPSR